MCRSRSSFSSSTANTKRKDEMNATQIRKWEKNKNNENKNKRQREKQSCQCVNSERTTTKRTEEKAKPFSNGQTNGRTNASKQSENCEWTKDKRQQTDASIKRPNDCACWNYHFERANKTNEFENNRKWSLSLLQINRRDAHSVCAKWDDGNLQFARCTSTQ